MHRLGHHRLQRHVVGLDDAIGLLDLVAHLVNAHVAALIDHLGGHDDHLAGLHPGAHLPGKIRRGVIGHTAHAEPFHYERMVGRAEQPQHIGPDAGNQLEHKDRRVQFQVGRRTAQSLRHGQHRVDLPVPDAGHLGVADAGEGVVTLGAQLFGPGAQHDLAVKDDGHAPGAAGGSIEEGIQQIAAAVGLPVADGVLRPRQHDGFARAGQHIAQGRRRIGHGIGAVGDDKTVIVIIGFQNGPGDGLPVFGMYVGAVQLEELPRFHLADFLDLGHPAQQFPAGQLGDLAFLCLQRGDGAAGGQHQDFLHDGSFPSLQRCRTGMFLVLSLWHTANPPGCCRAGVGCISRW